MNSRLHGPLQKVAKTVQRSLHSSSRAQAAKNDNPPGPSSTWKRRGSVPTPSATAYANRGSAWHGSDGNKPSSMASPTHGKYYSPSFMNLENHQYKDRKGRKYPILGPSAAVAKQIDPLYKLGLRPGHVSLHDDSYKNPVLLSQFVSEMGKIQGRKDTELTRRSQREVGKAIRRLRSMGLMPVMSKSQGRRDWN